MCLEDRSDGSLLPGANLALLDDELVQFCHGEQLGGHRFRLSRLLRGRRGTEWASADHEAGGRFILIEPAVTGVTDLPVSRPGTSIRFRGTGPGEDPAAADAVTRLLKGRGLLPPERQRDVEGKVASERVGLGGHGTVKKKIDRNEKI